jgi:hypothetical protein
MLVLTDYIADVQRQMENSSKKSIVKLSEEVQSFLGTYYTILKKYLHLYRVILK